MPDIISDISVNIFAADEKQNEDINKKNFETRKDILDALGTLDTVSHKTYHGDYWLFFDTLRFPKTALDRVMNIANKYKTADDDFHSVRIGVDFLYDYKKCGEITLDPETRVSDPCYSDISTWCAATVKTLPGRYNCYYRSTNEGRVASLKIVHEDYDTPILAINDHLPATIGVDSGTCGIHDFEYFKKNAPDEDWYNRIYHMDDAIILDNRSFITDSGWGDGSYDLFAAKNENCDIIALRIPFITFDDEDNDQT